MIAGKFEKVSLQEFSHSVKQLFGTQFDDEDIQIMYENIKLPKRATRGSAGYDFFAPFYFWLPSWGDIIIPTGVKAYMDDGWFLSIYPRSGTGSRNYLRIANTVPIIDCDYYDIPSNEGHIFIKLRKESGPRDTTIPSGDVEFKAGDAFCQGVFMKYGITSDDEAIGVRVGGHGSTDK